MESTRLGAEGFPSDDKGPQEQTSETLTESGWDQSLLPSASRAPIIPPRYSSLLPLDYWSELSKIKQRTVSQASNLTCDSSVSEFLESKIVEIDKEIEYVEKTKVHLQQALQERKRDNELDFAVKELDVRKLSCKKELVVLKRQRKLIQDDMEEEGIHQTVEAAYAQTMLNRVLAATGKATKQSLNQARFRKTVLEHYGALGDYGFVHCAVSGWRDASVVKAAHLVPKSLQSGEIAYLFGAGEVVLSDPRNGLMLHKSIELALDRGQVAVIPIPTNKDESTRWKLLLTDDDLRDLVAFQSLEPPVRVTRWKDLDGRELVFLNDNRPARRYLYFRHIMTYMAQKKAGKTDWTAKVESKGAMWATPGPYLRKSMLLALARQVSHHYLPEVFVEQGTFDQVPGSEPQSADDERTLGMSLEIRLEEYQNRDRGKRSRGEDDDDEESPEDSDFPTDE